MTSGAIQVLKTHPEKTLHLWVMSRTTCIFLVFGVSVRLADLPLRSATVVSVSGRLPRPDESR
jgi:hypothetical protein